ncbi:hypothetical protein [Alkalicoccus daliensis]|uniref:hypothetical protein n=1 Tax=Alkalicoccus daliensis TaxID=745820 RepID=UPI0011131F4E|nr:hypothetical protein [Alkalicoccus daliensis]
MDERSKIIVQEINKWKESRLLPETYCEFLLSLYLEGDKEATADPAVLKKRKWFNKKKTIFLLGAFLLLCTVIISAIIFALLPETGQIAGLGIILIVCLGIAGFYIKNKSPAAHIYIILAAFISFIFTMTAVELFFDGARYALGAGVALLCSTWLAAGWKFRIAYLLISGGTGLLFLAGLLLWERML